MPGKVSLLVGARKGSTGIMDELSGPRGTDSENIDEITAWEDVDFKTSDKKWSDLDNGEKARQVIWILFKIILFAVLLYLFVCSLSFLGNAFRLLGGLTAGEAFASNKLLANPVAGLMIGILATVLVQSSSTTTCIIIAMVASKLIEVKQAIPIVMGANIGTSVTSTMVSLAQVGDRNEFRRAFAGAVVHDVFNCLSVLVFLPVEVVFHYLYHVTNQIIKVMDIKADTNAHREFLSKITTPLTNLVVQLDTEHVLRSVILKETPTKAKTLLKLCRENRTVTMNVTQEFNTTNGLANYTGSVNVPVEQIRHCNFLFSETGMSDSTIGVILLAFALILLCTCLVCLVKLLESLMHGHVRKAIQHTVNADFPKPFHHLTGYLAMIVGMAMTVLMQSSSIFTSVLTPLTGLGVVSIERVFPLTLGANIGTTTTGILAAIASHGDSFNNALQIALCHLLFNVSGIILWYPIPAMRRVPIKFAKFLGNTTAKYRWFSVAYIVFGFFLVPASVFGLSLAGWQILLGVGIPILILSLFIFIAKFCKRKKPRLLPKFV
ncbi:sodium-dependent phosphate transport protein 2B isoform X1 [Exaiptasia diaphana]|uniref:Uncharacterized protein n=2 Tax=Exaiptasia diaphana TaxID=2652724 RepID=A0A913X7M1_EXADI|nr:sodium-dependent phosphate transport protein 2B isoform X1 [Exaiptasia diaphana]